ncbi:CRISPR-associated endonuclease Cas3'' [Sandarakinorhabdus sp.]|uniref:CRISPR-associated endonuclease Cas3'' n=1 Tax=Sandarakinorhabdus sp. TaxID=1916663 RepID=UPI003342C079
MYIELAAPRYAHSLPERPVDDWEPLGEHLREVGELAAKFATQFAAGEIARAMGTLHDVGKVSKAYQDYISRPPSAEKGPDHSTAGARVAAERYKGPLGRIMAFGIAGHHAGLANGIAAGARRPLVDRLDPGKVAIEAYDGWEAHAVPLPSSSKMDLPFFRDHPDRRGFAQAFLVRMLFSCLVDADFIGTERFYAEANGETLERGFGDLQPSHLEVVRAFMAARPSPASALNLLRADILAHSISRAELTPGMFTMTVPTGGGKTLTSLRFALEHAARHGLRRIIYVIPFTSIIEQTAGVFRDVPGIGDILEHHASFDWDARDKAFSTGTDDEGPAGIGKLRRATENWDAPIIVTTAVQFYESLFAARTSRCRKLHNLANSVIILDEAQTLPVPLLRPCMAALDELTRNYGASVVLCTATQPALRRMDGALPASPAGGTQGFDIDETRELAPDPPALFARLRRVTVEYRREPIADADIAARFADASQMLCIVNSRAHARDLFEAIRSMDGAVHLTTLMCAQHRRAVLAKLRIELAGQRPVRLVATSLIEAGVDVDFPEVWRAVTGLDSIAQAAGRCNREGGILNSGGRVVVFEPADHKTPRSILSFWDAARQVLGKFEDPLCDAAVKAYFSELYFVKGHAALDTAMPGGIMPAISETARGLNFPFADIADAFRMIDDIMDPVLIPRDAEAAAAIAKLRAAERPPRDVLRRLQQYSVSVPTKARLALIIAGAAEPIRPQDFGDRFVELTNMSLYDEALGLRFESPEFRTIDSNVMT